MNRAERIYRIDALLKEKPRSLEQLQAALEASRATVVRDLGYMRELMQAPIEYDRASNGYRYAADGPRFELPGFWLNESELFALLASGQMLDQMQPGLLAPYIGPLRGRICTLLAQSGHSAASVADSILLQPMATRTTHPERFGTIAGALLAGVPPRHRLPRPRAECRHRARGAPPAPDPLPRQLVPRRPLRAGVGPADLVAGPNRARRAAAEARPARRCGPVHGRLAPSLMASHPS